MSLTIGHEAETITASWLKQNNLLIVHQNFRSKFGEIDLIAKDQDTLVFIEVRLRSNRHYASAADSVDWRKQQRIIRTAHYFLMRYPQYQHDNIRFDVVSFSHLTAEPDWIRAAFDAI